MPKNNTIIDKSHSKKELLHIINHFGIPIGVSQKNNKFQIATSLWEILSKLDYIHIPKDNTYLIQDVQDLRKFLKNKNPSKILSCKDKDNVTFKAKKIIHYCNNGYNLKDCLFDSLIEIYNMAMDISKYGDITIVRRAIKLLMNDPNKLYNIEPKISPEVNKELHMRKILKRKSKKSFVECKVKFGKFVISFD